MADRDKDLESRSVEAFLWVHRSLTNMVKATPHMLLGEKRFTPEQYTRERQALDRQVWALTHNARLYVIHPETFARLYQAADVFTTEKIGGLPYVQGNGDPNNPALTTTDSGLRFMEAIHEAGMEVPVPEKLPFDSIFVCYGGNIVLSEGQRYIRKLNLGREKTCLIGHLMAFSQDVFYAFEVLRVGDDSLVYSPIFLNNTWVAPMDLNPWILNSLVAILTQQQKFVVEQPLSTGQRFNYRKLKRGKYTAPMPMPYYTIVIRDEVIDETTQTTNERLHKRTFEYSYRFDVQGHERCKLRRGPLPLDSGLNEKLEKYGYSIYTLNTLPAEHMERLGRRKIAPKKPDEWLAIKVTWVEEYRKGPDGTPYIPALRIPASQIIPLTLAQDVDRGS